MPRCPWYAPKWSPSEVVATLMQVAAKRVRGESQLDRLEGLARQNTKLPPRPSPPEGEPRTEKRQRQGPCVFTCTTTGEKRRDGAQKWLSLPLVCRIPKTGQHTRAPISYCLCCFSSPAIPANRLKQPWHKGRDLLIVCQALAEGAARSHRQLERALYTDYAAARMALRRLPRCHAHVARPDVLQVLPLEGVPLQMNLTWRPARPTSRHAQQ